MSRQSAETACALEEIEKQVGDDSIVAKQVEDSAPTSSTVVVPCGNHTNPALWCLLVISISSASFLYGFDLVIVATLQPNIIKDLGDIEKLPWITTSYLISCMGTLLLWARVYAYLNIKWTFIVAMLLFNAGSAISASAPTMDVLIGGRVLNGVGAIGIYAGSLHLITAITTIRQRTLYISFSTLAYGISSIVAPIVGGAFADSSAGWRWGFYVNICLSVGFTPAYILLIPSTSSSCRPVPLATCLRQFDMLGNILWACATSTLMTAVSFGGALYEWTDGRTIGLFATSGVAWILFVIQQWRDDGKSGSQHAFPVRLVRSWELCNLWLQTFCANASAFVPLTLIPLYFQFVRGSTALSAGLHLLPLVIGRMISSFLNGLCMRRYGYVMPWYVSGAILALSGSAPFVVIDASTDASVIYGCTSAIGFGSGLYLQSSFAVAQARSSAAMAQQAITFINLGQILGVAVPTAISNTVFINLATRMIEKIIPDMNSKLLQEAIAAGNSGSTLIKGLDAQQQNMVVEAFVQSLQSSWSIVVAAAGLSLICSFFISRQRLWK